MTRKLLAIYLVLVVLLAAFVPGCTGGTTGTIEVEATLDGSPWPSSGTGAVDYTLTGPGTAPTGTDSVPKSFTVDAGNWTCAYVGGGPGLFVDITPLPTQEVTAGGTKTFTLNFVTPVGPTHVDASVEFVTWSINGTPVPPGWHLVGPGAIIDVRFKKHVSGAEEGAEVTVDQTDKLVFHNNGVEGEPGGGPIKLHCVNAWGAVTTDPDSDKLSQQATVDGDPVSPCYTLTLPEYCDEVTLDVETSWEQKICTNYTKNINWVGIRPPGGWSILAEGNVVFEIEGPLMPGQTFDLIAWACVEVGEGFIDDDPDNNCTDPLLCPPLILIYVGPPIP